MKPLTHHSRLRITAPQKKTNLDTVLIKFHKESTIGTKGDAGDASGGRKADNGEPGYESTVMPMGKVGFSRSPLVQRLIPQGGQECPVGPQEGDSRDTGRLRGSMAGVHVTCSQVRTCIASLCNRRSVTSLTVC